MEYETFSPTADKLLNPDGSVTTNAGVIIQPADPDRAAEYASRMPQAAKWLLPDGSIVDKIPTSGGDVVIPKPYYFATCSTSYADATKILSGLPVGYVPTLGDLLIIKFTNQNMAIDLYFSIAGSTAKYHVLFNGLATNAQASGWKAGSVFMFYFDGSIFHQLTYAREVDVYGTFDKNLSGVYAQIGLTIQNYQLALERADGAFESALSISTPSNSTSKTVNANTDFRVAGMIWYLGGTTAYTAVAGRALTDTDMIQKVDVTGNILQYAMNGAAGLASNSWVYLVGIPQSDPMLYRLDPGSYTSWYTTTKPTTEDGKVYIRLGRTGTAAYNYFSLFPDHPAFWFKNGSFRPYLTQ